MIDSLNNNRLKTLGFAPNNSEIANKTAPIILVVDDDQDSRTMLKTLLEVWNFKVIEAADGREALSIAEKYNPNLILMDVKLPLLDGFAVTRKIRQSEIAENVPIIFLSACAEASYKKQASAVGGNEYLVKPLDFEKLEMLLGKYVAHLH